MSWIPLLREMASAVRASSMPLFGRHKIVGKGASGDLTEEIDRVAESAIIRVIEKRKIACTLVSEEIGVKEFGKGVSVYLIVDPIDGTTNAVNGVPFFASSLGIARSPYLSGVMAGVVMDVYKNVIFSAEKGKGAKQNGKKIRPARVSDVEKAIIGVDLSKIKPKKQLQRLSPLLNIAGHPRHFGANALELCYVANGIYDAFVDIRKLLRVTDIAAAYLIIKESGGIMLTPEGHELNPSLTPTSRVSFIAAGNNQLFNKISALIKT
jgi:myo-inositol-1(or 4)-monophosphatase